MIIQRVMLAGTVNEEHLKLGGLPYTVFVSDKYDGIRARVEGRRFLSRTNKPIRNQSIQANAILIKDGIEGELMLFKKNGKPKPYEEIESAVMSTEGNPDFFFCAFDYIPNASWVKKPYQERLNALVELGNQISPFFFRIIPHERVKSDPRILKKKMSDALARGFEGIMINDPLKPYKQGRSTGSVGDRGLMKMKPTFDEEAVILGMEEEMENANLQTKDERGYSKRSSAKAGKTGKGQMGSIEAKAKDGTVFRVGSGFTQQQRIEFWNKSWQFVGKQFTFTHRGRTKDFSFRQPTFKCLRKY